MTVLVRPVVRSDASRWLAMRQELWPEESAGAHEEEIEAFFAGRRREPLAVLIAEDSRGQLLGFAELSIRPHAEGCRTDQVAYLEGWFVAPEARRGGVGRILVEAAERWARVQGCTELASDSLPDDRASRAAHLAAGFSDAGLVRCYRKDLSAGARPEDADRRAHRSRRARP
jgi:aminoglycoside 6'-N-acetyltransferase I